MVFGDLDRPLSPLPECGWDNRSLLACLKDKPNEEDVRRHNGLAPLPGTSLLGSPPSFYSVATGDGPVYQRLPQHKDSLHSRSYPLHSPTNAPPLCYVNQQYLRSLFVLCVDGGCFAVTSKPVSMLARHGRIPLSGLTLLNG